MMPGTTGMDLLKAAKTVAPETEVVLMTAYGTVETAVDAMKEGAYDFVTKPLKRAHVVRIVRNALDKQSLVVENRALRAQLAERRRRAIIGTSLPWRRTMDTILQAAASEATVLLLGESGTGKELLARALHDHSPRGKGAFIAINCAAIPESILEGELFGYERGAFTGATTAREGRFEAAHGGTLFLDEIGEISRHVQVKLLRVLQEGEIERLGAAGKTRRIDIRLVAATNVDLAAEVKAGRFREDLYYRLNVIPVHVPPLRDRRDDITAAGPALRPDLRREERQDDQRLHRRRAREAVRLPLAGKRARARERDRAGRGTHAVLRDRRRRPPARGPRRPPPAPRPRHVVRHRHPARTRSRCGSSARPCATPAATSGWPPSCSASRPARSTAAWPRPATRRPGRRRRSGDDDAGDPNPAAAASDEV